MKFTTGKKKQDSRHNLPTHKKRNEIKSNEFSITYIKHQRNSTQLVSTPRGCPCDTLQRCYLKTKTKTAKIFKYMPRQYIWRTAGGVTLSGQILTKETEERRPRSAERRKRTSTTTEVEWNGAKAKAKRCACY